MNFSRPNCRNSGGGFAMRVSALSPFSNKAQTGMSTGSSAPGKPAQFLSLNAAPIDIAPVLRRMLFRDDCSCIMTSATLAVGRPDLAYFRDRIGADEAEPVQLGSPFDFTEQMKLFVVQKMPDPRDAGYDEALAKWVAHFVEETDGRAFVLFTSYRGMQSLARRWKDFLRERK